MAEPDAETGDEATPGEWMALLAPLLATARRAEDVNVYVVITQSMRGQVELHTNAPDRALRDLLRLVMPEGARG